MSHVKTEIFYSSCDYLLITHICFKFSRHGLGKVEIYAFLFVTWSHVTTWTKEPMTLKQFVASYHKLPILPSLVATGLVIERFLIVMWPDVPTWSTGYVNFVGNIFSSKATSLSSLVAIGLVDLEILLFFICHVITWPRNVRLTWLFLRWYFALNHQPVKYGGNKCCESRDR